MCWQVPLRLEHATDENGHLTSRLRDWKRRDWGEGGAEFHWWCTESPEAFVGAEPVYVSARDEIVELVGQQVYETLRGAVGATGVGAPPPPGAVGAASRRPAASDPRIDRARRLSPRPVSSSSNSTPYFSAIAA